MTLLFASCDFYLFGNHHPAPRVLHFVIYSTLYNYPCCNVSPHVVLRRGSPTNRTFGKKDFVLIRACLLQMRSTNVVVTSINKLQRTLAIAAILPGSLVLALHIRESCSWILQGTRVENADQVPGFHIARPPLRNSGTCSHNSSYIILITRAGLYDNMWH